MITLQEKPLHWVEAFGLSALVHVGLAYFVLTAVVDVGGVLDRVSDTPSEVQITSLSVETATVFSPEIGTGLTKGTGADHLQPVAQDNGSVAPPVVAQEAAAAASAPDRAEAVMVEAAAQPVTAQAPVQAAALAPAASPAQAMVPLSPLRAVTPTRAALPATVASDGATAPASTTRQIATAPVTAPIAQTGPVAAAPVQGAVVTAAVQNRSPNIGQQAPSPAPLPATDTVTDPDPLAEDLINRIRAAVGTTCMIALPQQQNGTVALQVYAADETAVGTYVDAIFTGLSPRPAHTTTLIDARQCAALDYIRGTAGYPTGPMALGLDATRIDSGSELTGRLSGTGGRNITLVLVDDNGVTQDLSSYLTVGVNTGRFAAPLRRAGPARDTRQLLLAIGTATRPASSSRQNGRLAEDYFGALSSEVAERATISLVPFDVR